MLKRFFDKVKSLNLSEKLLLALIFVLPLERIPSVELSGLTIKPSLLIGLALIITAAYKNLASGGQKLKTNLAHALPGCLLLYSLLTFFWSGITSDWLKANLTLGFVVLLFYEVCRVVAVSKNTKRLIEFVLKTILISALVIIALGFLQWFGDLVGISPSITQIRPEYAADKLGLTRMHSTLLEPLYFGLYLLLPLSILWADRAGQVVKNLYWRFGLISLIYLAILLSLARGAIVASAVVGLIGLAYNFKSLREQLKPKDLLNIGLALLVGLVILIGSTSLLGKKGTDEDHNYSKGFSTIVGHLETIKPWGNKEDAKEQNSINSRDQARSEVWDVITDSKTNFIFGVGAGQYGENQAITSNFLLLDVWVEYGLIGLALLVAFIISLFELSLKNRSSELEKVLTIGFAIYLTGFLIQSITFGELSITHLWVMAGVVVGLSLRDSQKG